MTPLNALAHRIVFAQSSKGFSFGIVEIHQKLLLAVSEICEAQEEIRDGRGVNEIYYLPDGPPGTADKPEGFPVEIADAIIRLLHICANFDIDIDAIIELKLAFNASRPMKHGRQF